MTPKSTRIIFKEGGVKVYTYIARSSNGKFKSTLGYNVSPHSWVQCTIVAFSMPVKRPVCNELPYIVKIELFRLKVFNVLPFETRVLHLFSAVKCPSGVSCTHPAFIIAEGSTRITQTTVSMRIHPNVRTSVLNNINYSPDLVNFKRFFFILGC